MSTDEISGKITYNEEYYRSHCGPVPYRRDEHWLKFFGNVADTIVRSFAPRKAFDAGCAIGLLVECLWDRGVETHGRDISAWALEQARPDIRPYLEERSIAEPLEGEYDFVSCIEVLEHVDDQEARQFIANVAATTPRVLFSSSPTDFAEPTHINVRPSLYWLELWAEAGFAPSVTHDAGYLAPHAYILERSAEGRSYRDLVAFADRIRHRVALASVASQCNALLKDLASARKAEEEQGARIVEQGEQLTRIRDEAKREVAESGRRVKAAEQSRKQLLDDLSHTRLAQTQQNALIAELQEHLRHAHSERDTYRSHYSSIMNSTTWRATSKILSSRVLSSPKRRRALRRAMKYGWWLISFQILARLQGYRERMTLISSSEDFSPSWYLAKYPDVAGSGMSPVKHYSKFGYREERAPHPEFDADYYRRSHPSVTGTLGEVFLEAIRSRTVADGIPPRLKGAIFSADTLLPSDALVDTSAILDSAHEIVDQRFPDLTPLAVYASPGVTRRITVVTNSIGHEHLFGGVGTALIFAALAANRLNADLRIVTRSEECSPEPLTALFAGSGIFWEGNVEMLYSPKGFGAEGHTIPVCEKDIFITTSWWTTRATMLSVDKRQIVQLVQEDERMFYPHGEEHLRCTEVFSDESTLKIVNSNLLLEHFRSDGLLMDASAFEPSFPKSLYFAEKVRKEGKKKFFFYARPHNYRNLYYRGLEAVSACIERGILDPAEWDFYFAGYGTDAISLPKSARSTIPGVMAWPEYAEFIRGMDLGLSLMYTPHPSYPPLDLAASGCVVVTNKFSIKQDLDQYSENIICSDPDLESLISSLSDALALSINHDEKTARYERSRLSRDWTSSMASALNRLSSWVEG